VEVVAVAVSIRAPTPLVKEVLVEAVTEEMTMAAKLQALQIQVAAVAAMVTTEH